MNFHLVADNLFISTTHLTSLGVKVDAVKKWRLRKVGDWIRKNGLFFIDYETIPAKTKSTLPPKPTLLKEANKGNDVETFHDALKTAKCLHFPKFQGIYEAYKCFTAEQITSFSQRHAVFQCILDMRQKDGLRDLQNLLVAFNKVFSKGYKSKHAFSNALRKAATDGIETLALDKRVYGNNQNAKKATSPEVEYLIKKLVASPRKFTNSQMLEYCNAYFKEVGYPVKSLSWVKQHSRECLSNIEIYKSRFGKSEAGKKMPHASLIQATFSDGQWQMDGKTLPFWGAKYKRYTLVFVIDSHSKKIIGWSFGEVENTQMILDALRNAICNTGVLPNELVMDKSAFTKTKDAAKLEDFFSKRGRSIKVTMNPQEKAIVERYNQYLDKHWSKYYGYLGKGIKSISKNARPSDETASEYAKNFQSKETIYGYTSEAINVYNETPLNTGKTPIVQYLETPSPYPLSVSNFDKAELFLDNVEKLIRRGQITIMRGTAKHEFQLPANLFEKWNDKTVTVTYGDLGEGIYLYEKETGKSIIHLHPKDKIHAAAIDQTDADREKLNKNKGRTKGIETQAKKKLEQLAIEAHLLDPEVSSRMDRIAASKQMAKIAQQVSDEHFYGGKEPAVKKEIPTIGKVAPIDASESFQPTTKKKDQPFTVKNNVIGHAKPFTDDESED